MNVSTIYVQGGLDILQLIVESEPIVNENCGKIRLKKIYKTVYIRGKSLITLLDISSNLHLIKAEVYIKLGFLLLTRPIISSKSLSKDYVSTLGSFASNNRPMLGIKGILKSVFFY